MAFSKLPVSPSFLEDFRIEARRQSRMHLVGGHTTRRMGQSLEFREYTTYNLGDDIRYVDWRASARSPRRPGMAAHDGWKVRRFTSEEHLELLISLDPRGTMRLPQLERRAFGPDRPDISKLQIARWIAEAITFIALRSDDQVVLHHLFGRAGAVRPPISGTGGLARLGQRLDEVTADIDTKDFNSAHLETYLPPAAVWVIISDFYFPLEEGRRVVKRIQDAQAHMRWVILVDVDSWPYERTHLSVGARLIDGPGSYEKKVHVTPARLDQIDHLIAQHKTEIFQRCKGIDLTEWKWPLKIETADGLAAFFRERWMSDQVIKRLFMREQ